jgi:hypothetical protein
VSSAPAPQFDHIQPVIPEPDIVAEVEQNVEAPEAESSSEPSVEPPAPIQRVEYIGVIHLTRTWVQYGILGFAVLCIVIGAVEALFGR